jgi:hypothetical protein
MLQHHCSTLLSFSPMLKHHCSTLFLPTPRTLQSTTTSPPIIAETTPSSNCFACSFSVAETPLSATLHHFFHDVEAPLFSTFDFFFHEAETPLFSMFNFFPMLKHHYSTLSTFFDAKTPSFNTLILKHQSSAVLHLQQLFHSSLLLKQQSFPIVCQQAFTTSDYNSTL